MSKRSFTKIWLHFVWGTKKRQNLLSTKQQRIKVSEYLYRHTKEKDIHMKKNYVNPDHVHTLIHHRAKPFREEWEEFLDAHGFSNDFSRE